MLLRKIQIKKQADLIWGNVNRNVVKEMRCIYSAVLHSGKSAKLRLVSSFGYHILRRM